jgi:molybdate transport system substrate-binding protein
LENVRQSQLEKVIPMTIFSLFPIGAATKKLHVYAPGGVRSAVQAAATTFEHQAGHTITFTFGTGGGIQQRVAAGALVDVTVLPSNGANELEKSGLVAPGSRVELGSVGVGVGIKTGTSRPKIGTVDEFRETLLAARSITYADPARGGTSGTFFATVVLPRLGIVEQMRSKTALTGIGEAAVKRVASGESEIVIVQASEIVAVPGAELVGLLPKRIQNAIPYAAFVVKSSKAPKAAREFVEFLVSPPGRNAFKEAGFEPPPEQN